MASKVSASSLISSLGPGSASRVSSVFALIERAASLTLRTGRRAIPASQYAPAPPSTATMHRPASEMLRNSSNSETSGGLRERCSKSCLSGEMKAGGTVETRLRLVSAADGKFCRTILGKVLSATVLIKNSKAKLSTSTSPADHSARRRRRGKRRFFHCQKRERRAVRRDFIVIPPPVAAYAAGIPDRSPFRYSAASPRHRPVCGATSSYARALCLSAGWPAYPRRVQAASPGSQSLPGGAADIRGCQTPYWLVPVCDSPARLCASRDRV